MPRSRGIRLLPFAALLTALTALAGSEPPPVDRAAAQGTQAPSTLSAEIQAVLDAQHASIDVLRERLAAATDAEQAIAIQREIEREKSRGEIQLLRLQLDQARERGHDSAAARLEVAIERLQAHVDRLYPVQDEAVSSSDSRR